MKTLRYIISVLTLTTALMSGAPVFADPEPVTKSAPIHVIFEEWSKQEAGEYIKYREAVFFKVFDVGYRKYRAKCGTKVLIEEVDGTRIHVIAQLTCTGFNVDDEFFDRFFTFLKDELALKIYRERPSDPREGGAGVRN